MPCPKKNPLQIFAQNTIPPGNIPPIPNAQPDSQMSLLKQLLVRNFMAKTSAGCVAHAPEPNHLIPQLATPPAIVSIPATTPGPSVSASQSVPGLHTGILDGILQVPLKCKCNPVDQNSVMQPSTTSSMPQYICILPPHTALYLIC